MLQEELNKIDEEFKIKIIEILKYQASITSQGFYYNGEKDWALNKILNLLKEAYEKGLKDAEEQPNNWKFTLSELGEAQDKSRLQTLEEVEKKIRETPKTLFEDIECEDTYEEGYEMCLDDTLQTIKEMKK